MSRFTDMRWLVVDFRRMGLARSTIHALQTTVVILRADINGHHLESDGRDGTHPARSLRPRPVFLAGFTLVELMVVLVILSILGSLMLSGISAAQASAKAAKTTSTIRKISELVLPYYERFETRRPTIQIPAATSRDTSMEARRVAIRRLMTMELPERTRDVADVLANPVYTYFSCTTRQITPVARRYGSILSPVVNQQKAITSADLLHMIVMRGPVADPDIVMHFRSDEFTDTNDNSLPEFIDGWGKPIYFKRWPVGFHSPTQPIDGRRSSIDETVSLSGHRLVPLIFSGGRDGEPDIEAGNAAEYYRCDYNPFAFLADGYDESASGPKLLADGQPRTGAVVLYPVIVPSDEPRTLIASRWGDPPPPDADVNKRRVAIGCESDTNGNGIMESFDNIHNHDLLR